MTLSKEAYPDSRVMQKEEERLTKLLKTQRKIVGSLSILIGFLGSVVVILGQLIDNPYAIAFGGAVILMGVVYGIFWIMDDE